MTDQSGGDTAKPVFSGLVWHCQRLRAEIETLPQTPAFAEMAEIVNRQIARLHEVYMRDTMDSGGAPTLIEPNR